MGERTLISWCDHTFNPWIGCMKVSDACDGCYAARLMDERLHRVEFGGPGKGAGTRSRTSDSNWREPLKWNRAAAKQGTRPFVFGGSLMDPFDNHVLLAWRREYFRLIRNTPHLVWLLLTKRPTLVLELTEDAGGLPPNVAIGTTAEHQKAWDQNVPALLHAKASLMHAGTSPLFAFVSIEPMLGFISPTVRINRDLRRDFPFVFGNGQAHFDPFHPRQDPRFRLEWAITGGETDQGPHKARPWHPDWPRRIRDDCAIGDAAYHHKQNGEWLAEGQVAAATIGREPEEVHVWPDDKIVCAKVGKQVSGRLLDGVLHDARPEVPALA